MSASKPISSITRSLDLVIVSEGGDEAQVFYYEPNKRQYDGSAAMRLKVEGRILNLIVGDHNHDGLSDIMVQWRSFTKLPGEPQQGWVNHSLWLSDGVALRESKWQWPAELRGEQAMPLHLDGRLHTDWLAITNNVKDSAQLVRAMHQDRLPDAQHVASAFKVDPSVLKGTCRLASPHWSAQVDVDGDGIADLVLGCAASTGTSLAEMAYIGALEVWLLDGQGGARLGRVVPVPQHTVAWTVGDVDGDGAADLLLLTCYPFPHCQEVNALHTLFNRQRPFCQRHQTDDCRPLRAPADLVRADERWGWMVGSDEHLVRSIVTVIQESSMVSLIRDPVTEAPLGLHLGDYDLDGHPDVLLTLAPKDDSDNVMHSRIALLKNLPCTVDSCSKAQVEAGRRHFSEVIGDEFDALRKQPGAISASFADWEAEGPLSFLVNGYAQVKGEWKPRHWAIRNALFKESFSLRIQTLNGVCPAPCSLIPDSGSAANRPYAVGYRAATYRFTYVDLDEHLQVRWAANAVQSTHGAKPLPITVVGLGGTSTFVDQLVVALPANPEIEPFNWYSHAQLIPNSDLIFHPPNGQRQDWYVELHISPARYILWVLLSTCTALLILALLTAIFKFREWREDEQERRRVAQALNFDAI